MRNLSTYIDNLDFEYAISYSGFRGHDFEMLLKETKIKIQELENQKEDLRYVQKSEIRKQLEELKSQMNFRNSRVINKDGNVHKSTKALYRFERGNGKIKKVFEILKTTFVEQHLWVCAPIYRDAIVFYSQKDKINGILHICFGCDRMINEKEEGLEVDAKIFSELKLVLITLGHKIENG